MGWGEVTGSGGEDEVYEMVQERQVEKESTRRVHSYPALVLVLVWDWTRDGKVMGTRVKKGCIKVVVVQQRQTEKEVVRSGLLLPCAGPRLGLGTECHSLVVKNGHMKEEVVEII